MPSIPITTRAQIITLKALGYTNEEICTKLCLPLARRSIDRIYTRALDRGFDPEKPICLDNYVEDAPRSGRPTKQTEQAKAEVEAKVTTDRYGREKSAEVIAAEIGLSSTTVRAILEKAGYKKTKPTRKPGLTDVMKKARLEFCLAHVDKGDDFWHNVIWTDETSVVLGHRRGGYKVWRKSNERVVKSVIRPRWKGYSEFMFWGCFTYKEKGPCHIYSPETAAMKKQSLKDIEEINEIVEPLKRAEWERVQEEKRKKMKRRPSTMANWRWDKQHGKLSRSERGGIDWYRYWKEIQMRKLIPFAKKVNGIIVEDGAGCHAHWYVQYVYSIEGVRKLLWCGNSPDLNAIEPVWSRMKRDTTKKGAPQSRNDAEKKWTKCWKEDLPQEVLQGLVDRIREHMKRVIECEGGNEYEEGLKTRETLRKERVKKREQEKEEKAKKLQEMLDQQSQVRLIKKEEQAREKEFLARERLKDKERERKERESVRDARLKEFERLREQRAQQKMERKQRQEQKLEQKREQQQQKQQQREQREQQIQQPREQPQQLQREQPQQLQREQILQQIEQQLQRQQEQQQQQMELQQQQQREQMELQQQHQREHMEKQQQQQRKQMELQQQQQREQMELQLLQQREQMQLQLQQQRELLLQQMERQLRQRQRKQQLQQLRREELREQQREKQLQQQIRQELQQQIEQELPTEQEVEEQIEREIIETERYKQVEIQMEGKRSKQGKAKQQPEHRQTGQTRVLRSGERQVDNKREETQTERKQGKAKQLAEQPQPQAGPGRVLRKREKR